MATIIDMPKLSDTMTVGTVANWLKKEGDKVSPGDILAEIETDKATMELEAFDEGVLLKQIAKAGEQVEVGSPICAIGEKGEKVEVAAKEKPAAEEKPKEEKKADKDQKQKEEAPAAKEEENASAKAEAPKTDERSPSTSDTRVKISPLARKLAEEKGYKAADIKGTGPGGRVVKQDVLDHKPGAAASKAASGSAPAPILSSGIAEAADLPVSNIRGIIAKRLTESKAQAPHFYLEMEVEASALLALREQLNKELADLPPEQGGIKFTVNDFILKASAEALRRVPAMNRSWADKTMRQHANANIAFGVAVDEGLVTPVIKQAEAKSLRQVSAEAKQLIGKARSKKLKPDEMSGSTFTVTNLGMFGISSFYGIINQPNAAILSVGATLAQPVVNKEGQIVAGQIMKLGLSVDHRVVDGAVGAQFLQALKAILETPALILL